MKALSVANAGITMEADVQEDLTILKEAIFKELNDVEAIYLFGSVARGTYNASSDYDIVVFIKKIPRDIRHKISNIRNNASDRINRPIDLFVLDRDYLTSASPFLYEVYHNNILLNGTDVIVECEKLIKDIRPLFIDGVKVGYKIKANKTIAIKHMLDALDDKRLLDSIDGHEYNSILLQHMERLCESSTRACLCMFNTTIVKDHAFSSFIEKLLVPEADMYKDKLEELLPSLRKIQDESVYAREIVMHDGKIVLREYTDDEIKSYYEVTKRYYEICFNIVESQIGEDIPRNKEGLLAYMKSN